MRHHICQPMELTFLIGQDGKNIKREHSRRACSPCRQRKKRCLHTTSEHRSTPRRQGQTDDARSQHGALSNPSPCARGRAEQPSPTVEEQQQIAPRRPSASELGDNAEGKESDVHPFVGNTNPVLTMLENPDSRNQRHHLRRGNVGAWLSDEIIASQSNKSRSPPTLEGVLGRSINGILPPRASQEVLVDLYFHRIHPVLPMLNEDLVRSEFSNDTIPLPLLQSICLVASKDRRAVSFLRLGSDQSLLSHERFGALLYQEVVGNMPKREERKRVLGIQILALISLHEWGPHGSEDCSLNLTQAIHHAQTIGLHLARPGKEWDIHMKALFWCLWSLDRWSAVVNGRPIMLHDRDIGQDVTDIVPQFQPPFRLWLLLAHRLGEVIKFYRPMMRADSEQDPEIFTFEDAVKASDAWNVNTEILSSLELFHHAIVILSTHSKGLQGRSHSQISRIRQNHSILSITALCRSTQMADLLPISIAAYTFSLALSVTYIQFKEAKLNSAKLVAKQNIELFYERLAEFSDTWWLAAVMMRLGRQALDGIQRRLTHEQPDRFIPGLSRSHTETGTHSLHAIRDTSESDDLTTAYSGVAQGLRGAHGNINTMYSSDFGNQMNDPVMSFAEDEFFDAFLENFADVNFPSASGEYFDWDAYLSVRQ
ncbi:hypothetical protein BDV25DRAFT_150493 [Aspergillus avenaceus]|uniref:Xylanolytic transcriptional activator regulatory domain-containing protein n=1 Tax=Aspergillus avenaceus TaxID=36643 RepID=A0A5N6U2H4_ASPAV|nr:hypothetical protein BDV25DRAFT_150493 [Aspergillus avenaceus]